MTRRTDVQQPCRSVGRDCGSGVGIMGLSPQTGGPVNAYPPIRPGERDIPFWGPVSQRPTSAGSRHWYGKVSPTDSPSSHQPDLADISQSARGVDNEVGYGVVDPVAALTFDVPAGNDRLPMLRPVVTPPTAPPPPTTGPHPRNGFRWDRHSGAAADRCDPSRKEGR